MQVNSSMTKDASHSIGTLSIEQYLDDLSSVKPAPGGGAAIAICAAQGAALLLMCLNVSGKDHKLVSNSRFDELFNYLTIGRNKLLGIADQDANAFEKVMACYKMTKSTDAEKKARTSSLQDALKHAAEVPFNLMELTADMLDNASDVIKITKATVISDAAIGIDFLYAALKSSRHNVRVNLKFIKDKDFVSASENRIKRLTTGRNKQRKDMHAEIEKILTTS